MSNDQSFFNQAAGTDVGTSQPAVQAPSQGVVPQVTEPSTPAQLQELEQRILRQTQSMLDKGMSSVNKKVSEAQATASKAIASMEAAGIPLSEQQKAAYTRTLIDQAYGQPTSVIASSPMVQADLPDQANTIGSEVDKEISAAMQDAGVSLLPSEMQPYGHLSPFAFVSKAKELIEAKRVSQAQSHMPSQVPTGQAPAGSDALRNEYLAQRKQIYEGTHPTIKRGDLAGISDLYFDFQQRGMKGQV